MIKNWVTSAVVLLLFYSCQRDASSLRYRAFHTEDGWGYEIALRGKTIIRQDHLPAMHTLKGFATKKHAEQAAQLVIGRIKNNQPPTLSENDLRVILLGQEAGALNE